MRNKLFGVLGALATCLCLAGCGLMSHSTSSDGDSSSYSGSSSITGAVVVSEADLSKIGQTSVSSVHTRELLGSLGRRAIRSIESPTTLASGTAYLYEVKSDGSVIFTGITANVTEGSYTFSNIKDGLKYIVSVKAAGEDALSVKQALVMDSFVDVKLGQSTTTANLSEKTSLITHYMLEKVVKVGGNKFVSDTSSTIQDSALDVVNTGLADGSIQHISPVVAVTSNILVTTYTRPVNAVTNTLEIIENSDSVRTLSQQAALESKLNNTSLSVDQAKSLIRSIFGVSDVSDTRSGSDGDGPPEFFIDQFAQAFVKGQKVTLGDFATAFHNSLPDGALKNTYWTQANVLTALLSVFNTSDGKVKQLYTAYNSSESTSSIPATYRAIFPKSNRITIPATSATELNVPQMILVMLEAGLLSGENVPREYMPPRHSDGPLFDPFVLLKAIHYVSLENGKYYIVDKRISPTKTFRETSESHWSEVDALDARVSLYSNEASSPITRVILKYPKITGGTGTVEFTKVSNHSEGALSISSIRSIAPPKTITGKLIQKFKSFLTAIGISKFNQSLVQTRETYSENPFNTEWVITPYSFNNLTPTYISDFSGGTATIEAYAGDEKVATDTTTLYKFDMEAISWAYPRGMNMERVQTTGWDQDFEPDEFDTNSSNQAQPLLRWEAPDITLPEGYAIAYAVDLGMSASRIDFGQDMRNVPGSWDHEDSFYRWKRIWSSWEDGRYIRSNSFLLKQTLNRTVRDIHNNYMTTYEVNVTPLVIETTSGRVVWQGSPSRTNFFVGRSTPWSVGIHGTVTIGDRALTMASQLGAGTWKVGLFKMGGNVSGTWRDSFFNNSSSARQPVLIDDLPMIASLGTSEEIRANHSGTSSETRESIHEVSYSLPSFTKNNSPLTSLSNYRVMVWYDVDSAPNRPDWVSYGAAERDAIDFAPQKFLEFFDSSNSDIFADQFGIRLNNFTMNQSKSMTDSVENQVVNVYAGRYLR